MIDTPRIAMSPQELPQQRLHEVLELPDLPKELTPVVSFGSGNDGIFPKRRPRGMTYLGSAEWAWSPLHSRIMGYHLHRGRKHWLLYAQDMDPYDPDYAWMPLAHMAVGDIEDRTAAVHLMMATWALEAQDEHLDEFHWINQEGLLSVADWNAIARGVWCRASTSLSCADNQVGRF